jgi:N-acetylglucosaminyl-diphospho-decaprenol L-rhamnosyltransferase
VGATLTALAAQLAEGDEVIVVDNASTDGTPDAVRAALPGARVIETGSNPGFSAASNRGAQAASGDLLCFLNPDAVPQPGWREAITAPAAAGEWAAWQALVTAEDGRVVNTRGGVVHFTGIAWAGSAGEPVDVTPSGSASEPAFASGACLAIGRERFLATGGFPDEFFLYHEDVDLSLRLRLEGERLGVAAGAVVDHEYAFEKGPAKWRYLERNRWATIIRTYPGALIAVLAPGLLATELAIVAASLAGGWFTQKVKAKLDVLRWLPRLLRERRAIQARRAVSARDFASALTAGLDSAYLGAVARSGLLGALLAGYWRVALGILGLGRG